MIIIIGTDEETIETLKKLIKQYKSLSERSKEIIYIEDPVFRELLETIGKIITELRKLEGYDTRRLDELTSSYKGIVKEYNNIFGSKIDKGLDEIKKSSLKEKLKETGILKWGTEKDDRISDEVIRLSEDMELLLPDLNKIIELFEKEYHLYDEPTESTSLAIVENKSWIQRVWNVFKRFMGPDEISVPKDEGKESIQNIPTVDEKYISRKNLFSVLDKIGEIARNEDLKNIMGSYFEDKLKDGEKIKYYEGQINGKKFIALEDVKTGASIRGDVVIFIDNKCVEISYSHYREHLLNKNVNMNYTEIMFGNENGRVDRKDIVYVYDSNGLGVNLKEGIKRDTTSYWDFDYINYDKIYNYLSKDYNVPYNVECFKIENTKGEKYSFEFESDEDFSAKKLPNIITYFNPIPLSRKIFKKIENSDKYNVCSLQGYEAYNDEDSYVFDNTKEYSLDEALNEIGIQLPEGGTSVADLCPEVLKEPIEQRYITVPYEIKMIYSQLKQKDILKELNSIETIMRNRKKTKELNALDASHKDQKKDGQSGKEDIEALSRNQFVSRLQPSISTPNQERYENTQDTKNKWEIEPVFIDLSNQDEVNDWNNRLVSYKNKIDEEKFTIEDMPAFIRDYTAAISNPDLKKNENWISLKNSLEKIREKIADFYDCPKEKIFIGDYDGTSNNPQQVPYKVIFGNVIFYRRRSEIGNNLEAIIGDMNASFTSGLSTLSNISIVYGFADLSYSEFVSTRDLRYIGNGVSFDGCNKLNNISGIEKIRGIVLWGNREDLKTQYEQPGVTH